VAAEGLATGIRNNQDYKLIPFIQNFRGSYNCNKSGIKYFPGCFGNSAAKCYFYTLASLYLANRKTRGFYMSKIAVLICAVLLIAFSITYQLSAGRGGYLYCENCSYKSSELYLGGGQESSGKIVFCPVCRNYMSIMQTILRLDDGRIPEMEDKSQVLLCPVCHSECQTVDEGRIWDALWQEGGKTQYLCCPRCGKKSLYLKIEFLWD
jgi:hypothetical protein